MLVSFYSLSYETWTKETYHPEEISKTEIMVRDVRKKNIKFFCREFSDTR